MTTPNSEPETTICPFGPGGREFLPFPQAGYSHLHSLLDRARRESPVFHQEDLRMWVVSRHDDVVRVLQDDKTFSSSVRHVILANLADKARGILAATATFSAPNMGFDHVPDHTRLRKPFVKRFSAKGVTEHASNIRDTADLLLAKMPPPPGPVDLVHVYSRPLATRVIMDLIGLPADDYDLVSHYGEAVHSFFFGSIPPDAQIEYAESMRGWEDYLARFIETRRREPADDLTTYLLQEIDSGRVEYSEEEIIGFLSFDIVGAGIRSTSFALPTICRELLLERHYWDALREDPALFDNFFAEALRRSALGLGVYRQTTADVEVSGVGIPAGSIVWVMTASADNDEQYFPSPETFDPHRPNLNKSLSFGHSLHFCLGQNLARLVTRIGLEQLMLKYSDLQLTKDQKTEYDPSYNVMIMSHLLVDL
ncbi:MAG: hypothetical protein QOE61_2649 [Micromonosporaceae bacterium]|jgi:cytochrome P450|nr:hypothetical protein [Micromonosporaceae bacterium]